MARHGVTYSEVALAAKQLTKTGITVTIDHVREYLGTGSKTTIQRHLQRFREENNLDQSHLPGISKSALDLARIAQRYIDQAVKDQLRELEIENKYLKQQVTKLNNKINRLRGPR